MVLELDEVEAQPPICWTGEGPEEPGDEDEQSDDGGDSDVEPDPARS